MAGFWSPTTKAQVSGHKFLKRRVEHGLLFGDIRMILDPLAARSRAIVLGFVAVILCMLGAGLFAWMSPQPNPGQAPIVRAADGQLFVRIDDRIHPVANLTSARLIVGSPVEPENIGSDYLKESEQGVPVGIHPAPGEIMQEESGAWEVCVDKQQSMVVRAQRTLALGEDEFVGVHAAGRDWLVTAEGRHALPTDNAIRRALGITQVREVPDAWLNAVTEQEMWNLPSPMPEIVDDAWAVFGSTATPINAMQARILLDSGAHRSELTREEAAQLEDGPILNLPGSELTEVESTEYLCAGTDGVGHREDVGPLVELSGDGPASAVSAFAGQPVVVDTGHGFHVIAPNGLRHELPVESLTALGIEEDSTAVVPWEIISLLPEGPTLTAEEAVQAVY